MKPAWPGAAQQHAGWRFSVSGTRVQRRRFILNLIAFVLLLAGPKVAMATATCHGGGQNYIVNVPSSITVPRDAVVGTVLATFSYSSSLPSIWTCSVNNSSSTGAGFRGEGATVGTYTIAGQSVPAHTTAVPGVGIAFYVRQHVNGCSWQSRQEVAPATGYAWSACNQNGTVYNGLQIGMAFVKTGAIAPGILPGGIVGYGAANVDNNSAVPAPGTSRVSFSIPSIQISEMACETPDVMVRLGTHLSSEMSAIGATTQAVGFDIRLDNCPAGLGRIQYRIDPTTAVLSASDSVIALDGSSSASGVGVQLLDDDGTTAFQLGKDQTFSGYDPGAGGSYVIPLKARYYRVGGAISAGPANTSITMTMQYQ